MPEFAYIARDLTGNRVEGTLAAGTEREAVASLSGRRICFRSRWRRPTDARPARSVRRACGRAIMATTYGQLSALLGSGVPLLRSLEVIREQTPHKNLADRARRRPLARAGRRDAGRRDGPAPAGVRRAGARASSAPAARAASWKKRSTGSPSSPNSRTSSRAA